MYEQISYKDIDFSPQDMHDIEQKIINLFESGNDQLLNFSYEFNKTEKVLNFSGPDAKLVRDQFYKNFNTLQQKLYPI